MNNKQRKLVTHINTVEKLIERAKLREENLFRLEGLYRYLREEYEFSMGEGMAWHHKSQFPPGNDLSGLDLSTFTWVESPTMPPIYNDPLGEINRLKDKIIKQTNAIGSLLALSYANRNKHRPKQIIVNNVTTVCVFPDGTKVTSRPRADDEFDLETGVAMCIMKYIYGSRQAFRRAVGSAHIQPGKRE